MDKNHALKRLLMDQIVLANVLRAMVTGVLLCLLLKLYNIHTTVLSYGARLDAIQARVTQLGQLANRAQEVLPRSATSAVSTLASMLNDFSSPQTAADVGRSRKYSVAAPRQD